MSRTPDEPQEGFLTRWSRLKREPRPPEPTAPVLGEDTAAPPGPDGDELQKLLAELPKIEDLVPGQDLSMFMRAWVPEDLRNAALRKLWTIDPAVRDFVSEALDYAYDYNTPGAAPGFGAIETTADMVREVHALFDRALSSATESAEEGGDTGQRIITAAGDGQGCDTMSHQPDSSSPHVNALQHDHGQPDLSVPADSQNSGVLTGMRGSAQEDRGRAAQNGAPQETGLAPTLRRHGRALPS